MPDPRFWIWLQGALGLGNHKVGEVLRQFGSPEPLYRMGDRELTETGIFTPKEAASLRLSSLESAQRQVELARRYGCAVPREFDKYRQHPLCIICTGRPVPAGGLARPMPGGHPPLYRLWGAHRPAAGLGTGRRRLRCCQRPGGGHRFRRP